MNNMAGQTLNYVCSRCETDQSNLVGMYSNTTCMVLKKRRDYAGIIPYDAIPGGLDIINRTTYIGQGFHKAGLLTGTIIPGQTRIKLPYSTCSVSSCAKILCTRNQNCFSWEQAESLTLHSTTMRQHLVIGGQESGKIINVGRAMYQGELIVGKVLSFDVEKARLCFVYGDQEISVNSYQVLIYNPINTVAINSQ